MLLIGINSISNMGCHYSRLASARDYTVYRTYIKVQQTPNPAAQFPSTVPLLLEHSVSVIQVPYVVESEVAVH